MVVLSQLGQTSHVRVYLINSKLAAVFPILSFQDKKSCGLPEIHTLQYEPSSSRFQTGMVFYSVMIAVGVANHKMAQIWIEHYRDGSRSPNELYIL